MIDFVIVFKILSIFIVSLISPGPDFMIVSSISLTRGATDGVKAAAGIGSIISLYTLIGLTSLSALFAQYFWIVVVIKACGGLYLLYLGIQMWRGSFEKKGTSKPIKVSSKKSAYKTGVLTCLTNPKAIAFFASIFALALTPTTTLATKIVIGCAVPAITFLWFSLVAFGLSKPQIRLRYQRSQHIIDRVTGTVLTFFGLKLILSARS